MMKTTAAFYKRLSNQGIWLTALFLGLLTTAYILLFPTRHYTYDAMAYLEVIETGDTYNLLHSQHLLAQAPGFVIYRLFGGGLRAWQAMLLGHSPLAGLTVALLFLTTHRITHRYRTAVLAGLALWFSYGFWHFHSDPDVYALGYAAVTLLLLTFVSYIESPTPSRAVTLGLVGALAVLSHQMNVGLIGIIDLSLVWLAWRHKRASTVGRWQHVILYSTVSVTCIGLVYLMAWQAAGRYVVEIGGEFPRLESWFLRYFSLAQTGQANWGISFNLSSLPLAGYAFLSSWVLPPLRSDLAFLEIAIIGIITLSPLVWLGHLSAFWNRLPPVPRLISLVCGATVLFNGLAAVWWQAPNIKFYLFLQIPLLIIGAIYVSGSALLGKRSRRFAIAVSGVPLFLLAFFHLTRTIPYEVNGGVFEVARLADSEPVTIFFEERAQAQLLLLLGRSHVALLSGDFCTSTSNAQTGRMWWVVKARTANQCHALEGMRLIGQFQADRTRDTWMIFEAKP